MLPLLKNNDKAGERRKRGRERAEPYNRKRTKGSFRCMVFIERSAHPHSFKRQLGATPASSQWQCFRALSHQGQALVCSDFQLRVHTSLLFLSCRKQLHVIMDEIYALSVFNSSASFRSVLSLPDIPDPQRTHLVWGISKVRPTPSPCPTFPILSGLI